MAIKFVDKEFEDGKPKKAEAPKDPPHIDAFSPLSEEAPELPLPKPTPRGRKKPLW